MYVPTGGALSNDKVMSSKLNGILISVKLDQLYPVRSCTCLSYLLYIVRLHYIDHAADAEEYTRR